MTFDEHGSVGGLEGLAFGVLVFAFGTLMMINAWAVVDAKITAGAAAREATRAYVEAPNDAMGRRHANEAVAVVDDQAVVSIAATSASRYHRCMPVQATVSLDVPRISLPFLGGRGGTMTVTAAHSEIVDPYRSGVAAVAGGSDAPAASACS